MYDIPVWLHFVFAFLDFIEHLFTHPISVPHVRGVGTPVCGLTGTCRPYGQVFEKQIPKNGCNFPKYVCRNGLLPENACKRKLSVNQWSFLIFRAAYACHSTPPPSRATCRQVNLWMPQIGTFYHCSSIIFNTIAYCFPLFNYGLTCLHMYFNWRQRGSMIIPKICPKRRK